MAIDETLEQLELTNLRAGRCPVCQYDTLVAGPIGGASRNVYCPQCHEGFNAHGVRYGILFKIDRIGRITDEQILWALKVYRDDQPFRLFKAENDDGPTDMD